MTFEELLEKAKQVEAQERRSEEADFLESVIAKSNLEKMSAILRAYFSEPLKPEGEEPSAEVSRQAEPYGGIRTNQTLYFKKRETSQELALLWPWGNGVSITVMIIRK